MECRGLTQEYTGATGESSGLDGHDETFVPRFSSDRLLIPETDNGFLMTGDRELGTGDRRLGTGDRGPGTGDWGLGTGDRGQGTGNWELGTGDRGPGTSNQQLATSYWLFGISLTNRGASSSHSASSRYARVLAVFSACSWTSPRMLSFASGSRVS